MRPNAFLRMRDLTDLFSQTLEKKRFSHFGRDIRESRCLDRNKDVHQLHEIGVRETRGGNAIRGKMLTGDR